MSDKILNENLEDAIDTEDGADLLNEERYYDVVAITFTPLCGSITFTPQVAI